MGAVSKRHAMGPATRKAAVNSSTPGGVASNSSFHLNTSSRTKRKNNLPDGPPIRFLCSDHLRRHGVPGRFEVETKNKKMIL